MYTSNIYHQMQLCSKLNAATSFHNKSIHFVVIVAAKNKQQLTYSLFFCCTLIGICVRKYALCIHYLTCNMPHELQQHTYSHMYTSKSVKICMYVGICIHIYICCYCCCWFAYIWFCAVSLLLVPLRHCLSKSTGEDTTCDLTTSICRRGQHECAARDIHTYICNI